MKQKSDFYVACDGRLYVSLERVSFETTPNKIIEYQWPPMTFIIIGACQDEDTTNLSLLGDRIDYN